MRLFNFGILFVLHSVINRFLDIKSLLQHLYHVLVLALSFECRCLFNIRANVQRLHPPTCTHQRLVDRTTHVELEAGTPRLSSCIGISHPLLTARARHYHRSVTEKPSLSSTIESLVKRLPTQVARSTSTRHRTPPTPPHRTEPRLRYATSGWAITPNLAPLLLG